MTLVYLYAKFFREDAIQPHELITKDARGVHGIEQTGKFKAKVTPQANKVIFCGMKYLFDPRVVENRSKRIVIFERKRINHVVFFRRRELHQTHLFTIRMQTV